MHTDFSSFWATYALEDFSPIWGRQFFNQYGKIMQWVEEQNISRPYHSTRHLIGVGVLVSHLLSNVSLTYYRLTEKDRESAVIAGLLHDFCHQGEKNDWKNIEHAFQRLEQLGFWRQFPTVDKTLVTLLIGFTHYDFDDPFPQYPGGSVLRYLFGIIRDADQLYAMTYLDEEIFDGLYQEIGVRFGQTREAFTERNVRYIKGLNFYTAVGAEHAEKYKETAINKCQQFLLNKQGDEHETVSGQ